MNIYNVQRLNTIYRRNATNYVPSHINALALYVSVTYNLIVLKYNMIIMRNE